MTLKLKGLTLLAPLLMGAFGVGCNRCGTGPEVLDERRGAGVSSMESLPASTATADLTTPRIQEIPAVELDREDLPPPREIGPGVGVNRTKIIYFDFDECGIRPDQMAAIEYNADWIKAHPDFQVRLEGHCDERGTEEYNIGLGDRRARSVKRQLVYLGVNPNRLYPVSYGEMKPANPGHDEAAWAQNRRVELWISRNR